jgi:hypothetical protein
MNFVRVCFAEIKYGGVESRYPGSGKLYPNNPTSRQWKELRI